MASLALALFFNLAAALTTPPGPEWLRNAYRDPAGNLIVTFARHTPDLTSGDTLGAMYCDPRKCSELVTQFDVRKLEGPYVRFGYGQGARGDLILRSNAGVYQLACTGAPAVDLMPVAGDDLTKLSEGLKSGRIAFDGAPVVFLPEFIGKSRKNGTYIYLDADVDKHERLFVGAPGLMVQHEFRQSHSACGFAGCRRTLEYGGFLGKFATHVDITREGGAIDREPVAKLDADTFDVAQLKIPGVPDPAVVNQRNPCQRSGASPAGSVAPATPPASGPAAR